MTYRILFSGLMAFVEHHAANGANVCESVDVLLLNPCALHGAGEHKARGGNRHNQEASCTDLHEPQLMVKSADIADWRLDGVLQGCGWHHFNLKRQTVFPEPGDNRQVQLRPPDSDEFSVDPFGEMQHVSFLDAVDMEKVLGDGKGSIDPYLQKAPAAAMIVARVRLPAGKLTALAPPTKSTRNLRGWTIGKQNVDVLAEMAMFESNIPNNRIELMPGLVEKGKPDFVTWRANRDVTVWITNEPRRQTRTKGKELIRAEHFQHYYRLLPQDQVQAISKQVGDKVEPQGPVPDLQDAANIDNPLCPFIRMRSNP